MFAHKKGSVTDLKTSAVVEELIYIDTRLWSASYKNPSDVILGQSANTCPKSPASIGDFKFQVTSLFYFQLFNSKRQQKRTPY